MAFHEESVPAPQYASPLMAFEGATLLALLLQFIAGGVSIYYAIPGVIVAFSLLGVLPMSATGWIYMVAWTGLAIVLWPQLYSGYRLYKKTEGAVKMALATDIVACILYALDVVLSAIEGILLAFPEVILFFGINVVVVILLMMPSVKEAFSPHVAQPYPGTQYGTSEGW